MWADFEIIKALYDHGRLKAAARALNVDQATVGRRLARMEEQFGTPFFKRTAAGYLPLQITHNIIDHLTKMEGEVLAVQRALTSGGAGVATSVTLAAPGALTNHLFVGFLDELLTRFPRLQIAFLNGPEVRNLARREADIAIQLVRPEQPAVFRQKVGRISLGLCGSRTLFRHNKTPRTPADLAGFPFLSLFEEAMSRAEWDLVNALGDHLTPRSRSSAWSQVFYGVKAGAGIGFLPSFFWEKEPELIPLNWAGEATLDIWLCFHSSRKGDPFLRALFDFLKEKLTLIHKTG